ncbi:MAG: (Fe-S)-binding protein [Marinisporobacter sp.]|nr:(Fe-S)-binding protein [Marinisporobacter sp.]
MEYIRISEKAMKTSKKIANDCIGCQICMKNCPMLKSFCSSPKELFQNMVKEKRVRISIPYACNLCGYCTRVCPKGIDLKKAFLDLREDIFKENKNLIKGYEAINFHQMSSFSKLFTASAQDGKKMRRAFIPGCSLTAYNPNMVMKTYKYLKEKLPDTGIILKCCGNPTHSIGDAYKFKEYYGKLQEEIEKMQVEEVIVACQNCFMTIKENSSHIKVTSLWEVVAEMGVPEKMKNKGKDIDIAFTIHDPCPTRDEIHIHDSVRRIMKELGFKAKEFQNNREKTSCCGMGAMVILTNSEIGLTQMKRRANEAETDYILSYCQSCVEAMMVGGKKGVHLLDLLVEEEMYKDFNQKKKSTIKKWLNRYKGKRKIENLK